MSRRRSQFELDRRRYRMRAALAVLCVFAAATLALVPDVAAAGDEVALNGLRSSTSQDRDRLVFELGAPVQHEIFTLSDPDRVVIDIDNAELKGDLPDSIPGAHFVEGIRSAPRNGDDLRVVLDLARPGQPKSFLLQPAGGYGHRLVVDVTDPNEDQALASANGKESSDGSAAARPPRDLVIEIDPGHGGKDPGAAGPNGTKEKNVVLAIARRLKALLDQTPGFKAVMTRNSDVFLPLRERIRRARKAKADMFVSVHADAFRSRYARGSSVYALSLHGASSEAARWLANNENSADLIGGVSLDDKDEMVASVLLDLSQTATIESSLDVGNDVLNQLDDVNRLHKHTVQQAGFVVLKSPDIPSILVETAFISNPSEEKKLRSPRHQEQLARAIRDGIRNYFDRKAPPGTVVYAQNRASSG